MAVFVPDASLALTWCFEDEATPRTDDLLRRLKDGDTAAVPLHWPAEIVNGLVVAVRRNRISEAKAERFRRDLSTDSAHNAARRGGESGIRVTARSRAGRCALAALPIRIDPESGLQAAGRVFALAQTHRLTAYDAAYLEVALRMGAPLATLDQDLMKAATDAGVMLL